MNKITRIVVQIALFSSILISVTIANETDSLLNISLVGPETRTVDTKKYQQVIYVSINNGSDKSDMGTQKNPWQTIAHALSKIEDAGISNRYAIFVAKGIYSSETLVMKEFIDMYGGFNSKNWQRDIFNQTSILDGEGVRRVVLAADNACIDGFTIRNGLSRWHGAGILCDDTSPLISNNFITENLVLEPEDFNHSRIYQEGHHGAGIASLYNAVPIIKNNIIYNNRTSVGYGAGVAFFGWFRKEGVIEPVLQQNILKGGPRAVMKNNVVISNIAGVNDKKRTRSSSGGGIVCAFEARPIIRNNIIANNQAKGRSDAGGIYNEYFSYPTIEGNWIVGNVSDDDGGAIYTMRMGHPVMSKNIIAGNRTFSGNAGGIRLSKEGRAKIVDNIIVRNPGGGVMCIDSYMQVEGNIIMHNENGSAISYLMRFSYFMPTIIRNNILRENIQGPLSIMEDKGQPLIFENNNIDTDFRLKDNFDQDPGFLNDGIKGVAKKIEYDPNKYITTVIIRDPLVKSTKLTGKVLKIGDKWSVIKEVQGNSIFVWGDVQLDQKDEQAFEVLPSYSY